MGVCRSVMILPYIYLFIYKSVCIHTLRKEQKSVPPKSASGFMNRTLEPAFKSMQMLGRLHGMPRSWNLCEETYKVGYPSRSLQVSKDPNHLVRW